MPILMFRLLLALAISIATFSVALYTRAAEILPPEQVMAQQPPTTHIFAGITIGDLVKLANDNDPATTADSVVYYFDLDWKRHPFPNRQVFDSWYADFSKVKEVTPEQLAAMRLGTPILYRPGTRLVKIPSIPKVYAVEPGGVLRWITTEEVAIGLYGADWSKKVDDVSESFFIGYKEGPPLRTVTYPTGTLLRLGGGSSYYVVDGSDVRFVATQDFAARFRYQSRYAVDVPTLPGGYENKGTLVENGSQLTDTAQISFVDTLPSPQAEFLERSVEVQAGADRRIASVRLTVGRSVQLRRIAVKLDGAWAGTTSVLSDIRLVERATGEVLFGIHQLAQPEAASETVTFQGSHILKESTLVDLDVVATVAEGHAGKTVTATFEQPSVIVAAAANADIRIPLMPQTPYPALMAVIK